MCYRSTMLVISILSACIIAVTPCKQYNNHQPTHRRFIPSKLAFIKHKHQNNNISFTTSTHQESYSGKKSSLICKDVLFGLRCGASTSEDGVDQEEEIPIDNDDEKSEQIAVDISVETSTTDELDNEIESPLADESVNEEEGCSDSEVTNDNSDVEETVMELVEDVDAETDEANNSEAAPTPKEEDDGEDLIAMASSKRHQAKALHDSGSLHDAAIEFHNAASLLDDALSSSNTENDNIDIDSIVVERATCKLHEALCLFKDGRPGECIDACTDVLGDGVVVQEENVEEGEAEEDGEEGEDNKDSQPTKTTVVKVIPVDSTATSTTTSNIIPSLIRARAHHRRAKARLALNDLDGALDDARSAAFMGDRNAVQFYGRLMREGSGAVDSSTGFGGSGMSSPFGDGSSGDSSNPFLEGMLQSMGGTNNNQHPLMPSGAGSSDFQSSLLSSLLTSNNSPGSGSGGDPFGLMSSLLGSPSTSDSNSAGKRGRRGKSRKGKSNNLAKSVMSNLLKRVEEENTQETICTYLQSTNTQQIMTFASMAGVQMKEDNARRLASLANGVTVKGIRKSITNIKRFISITKTCRKILKVIDKYKAVIVLGMLFYWARSAVNRPIAITSKRAKKELQQAAAFLIAPSMGSRRQLSLENKLCNGVKSLSRLCMSGGSEDDDTSSQKGIEEELERLQNQLSLIEALEERNKAQLESFVDEKDQWESLEEDERVLLSSKDEILKKMEILSEEIVMLFMKQKVKNG